MHPSVNSVPKAMHQNRRGARPQKKRNGIERTPPMPLGACQFRPVTERMRAYTSKTLILLASLTWVGARPHSAPCWRMHEGPEAAWNSARKAEVPMVRRTACFFHHDQFRGSKGSSDGWGIKTVCTEECQPRSEYSSSNTRQDVSYMTIFRQFQRVCIWQVAMGSTDVDQHCTILLVNLELGGRRGLLPGDHIFNLLLVGFRHLTDCHLVVARDDFTASETCKYSSIRWRISESWRNRGTQVTCLNKETSLLSPNQPHTAPLYSPAKQQEQAGVVL